MICRLGEEGEGSLKQQESQRRGSEEEDIAIAWQS